MTYVSNVAHKPIYYDPTSAPLQAPKVDMFDQVKPSALLENKNLFSEAATIPCFDPEIIESASPQERAILIKEFGDAWQKCGFFGIKAASLVSHTKKVYEVMSLYFHQTLEEKMKDVHGNFGVTGFSPQGETAAGMLYPDRKEVYFLNHEMYGNAEKWPAFPPSFRETMTAYHQELSKYTEQVFGYFFEYLGIPAPFDIKETLKTTNNLMRLAYYPKLKDGDPPQAMRASPHTDLNALTALPIATGPGLEMLVDDQWIPVVTPEGYLVFNTGDQFEYYTGKRFKAVTHRVSNIDEDKERLATIFFGAFPPNFSLKPLDCCTEIMTQGMNEEEKMSYLAQFHDVTAQELTISRLIEMTTIAQPSEEMVHDLLKKGLLKQAPDAIKAMYPHLFKEINQ